VKEATKLLLSHLSQHDGVATYASQEASGLGTRPAHSRQEVLTQVYETLGGWGIDRARAVRNHASCALAREAACALVRRLEAKADEGGDDAVRYSAWAAQTRKLFKQPQYSLCFWLSSSMWDGRYVPEGAGAGRPQRASPEQTRELQEVGAHPPGVQQRR